jgi:hypothetical protein
MTSLQGIAKRQHLPEGQNPIARKNKPTNAAQAWLRLMVERSRNKTAARSTAVIHVAAEQNDYVLHRDITWRYGCK